MADDFAFLSSDIIYNVLEFAHFERSIVYGSFQQIFLGGRWGEVAERFQDVKCSNGKIERLFYEAAELKHDYESSSAFDATDVHPNETFIARQTDFNEILHLAPLCYELLWVFGPETIPEPFLESLGARFTKIFWRRLTNSKVPLEGETEFFRRQLRSPHLRDLDADSAAFEKADFTDALVVFTSRTCFKRLKFLSPVSLSGRVFQAAYQAWLHREHHLVRPSIVADISSDDLAHLMQTIARNFVWRVEQQEGKTRSSYSVNHPTNEDYKLFMYFDVFWSDFDRRNFRTLTLDFSR